MNHRAIWLLLAVTLTPSCATNPKPAPPTPTGSDSGGTSAKGAGPTAAPLRDTHENLNAVLWMQSAAEYQALSASVYHMAEQAFDRISKKPTVTAAIEQEGRDIEELKNLKVAVVMDLDETVLDNSPSQGQTVLDRTIYTPTEWFDWVKTESAGLVPGARQFIGHVRENDGKVFFVTNRKAAEEPYTLANLHKLGIDVTGEDILSLEEQGWLSDKTIRRAHLAQKYRLALLVGDDLGDFVSLADAPTPDARTKLAARYQDRWLDRWILLPNPAYGSWERSISAGLKEDPLVLKKKFETVKGYKP